MNKLLKLVLVGAVALMMSSTVASANAAKGQKLYLKKLKKACGMNGAKMSAKHSQDEWEAIKEDGKLLHEIKTICPKVKKVRARYLPDLYDFFYEFGNDSGNVPSC